MRKRWVLVCINTIDFISAFLLSVHLSVAKKNPLSKDLLYAFLGGSCQFEPLCGLGSSAVALLASRVNWWRNPLFLCLLFKKKQWRQPLESYSLKQNLVQFVLIFVLNTDLLFYKNQTQGVGTLPKYSKFNESVYAEKTFTLGLFWFREHGFLRFWIGSYP